MVFFECLEGVFSHVAQLSLENCQVIGVRAWDILVINDSKKSIVIEL